MPTRSTPPADDFRTALLLEAADVLVSELSTLSSQKWESVPELKKRKVVVASRLRTLSHKSSRATARAANWIERLVADLDRRSRRKIQSRLKLIGRQIFALQELDLYWRECLQVSLQGASDRSVSPDGSAA